LRMTMDHGPFFLWMKFKTNYYLIICQWHNNFYTYRVPIFFHSVDISDAQHFCSFVEMDLIKRFLHACSYFISDSVHQNVEKVTVAWSRDIFFCFEYLITQTDIPRLKVINNNSLQT
jgi:hypothetical protein